MWPAIIAGAATVAGGLLSNSASARQAANSLQSQERAQERQNAFSAQQQALQNEFAERMAGTAHQREVRDLSAAGLNPILSGTGGMGAPSPHPGALSGAGASGGAQAPQSDVISPGVASAMAARRNEAEIKLMRSQERQASATANNQQSQSSVNSVVYNRTLHEVDIAEAERDMRRDQAKGAKIEGDIDSGRYGAALRYLDRLRGTASSARQFMHMVPGRR